MDDKKNESVDTIGEGGTSVFEPNPIWSFVGEVVAEDICFGSSDGKKDVRRAR